MQGKAVKGTWYQSAIFHSSSGAAAAAGEFSNWFFFTEQEQVVEGTAVVVKCVRSGPVLPNENEKVLGNIPPVFGNIISTGGGGPGGRGGFCLPRVSTYQYFLS